MATLTIEDYIVIAVVLLVSSSIGVYYWFAGGRQKSTTEYFVANRSMRVAPVAIGLMVSYLSAVSLLGVSSENYVYGTQYAVINISYLLATPFVVYFYMPVFFKLGATSAFEYLQLRFGRATRLAASIAFLLQLLLYSGVVLYAPALALEATAGISITTSVIGIGLVCTFYSTIGGIKAVLVTDVFQSLLMLLAVIIVIVKAAADVGGLQGIWEIANQGDRIELDNVSVDPTVRHTWWTLTIGGFFTYLSLYGTNQVQVQRMLTVKNLAAAQKAIWWSAPLSCVMSLALCFSGLAIYSRYHGCDPLETGRITSADQLMPLYVMDTLSAYPGLPGLFIAGIFSAGLSTISATINSLAAVLLEDYAKPLLRSRGTELSATVSIVISKFLALLVGLACIAVAFLARYLGGVLQAALTIFGVVGGPIMGLFTLGMFTESKGQRGAVTGLLISLVFSLWIGFGQPKPPLPTLPVSTAECNTTGALVNAFRSFSEYRSDDTSYFYLYRLSYLWYCPLGCLLALIIGWFSNWLFGVFSKEESEEVDPDLLTPIVAWRVRRARAKLDVFRSTIVLDKVS